MNTQEIKGSFINDKSQLIILDEEKNIQYSCDRLVKVEDKESLIEQMPFLGHLWNLVVQLEVGKKPLVIPAVNIKNSNGNDLVCDVQINKVAAGKTNHYHVFIIDAFPFDSKFETETLPDETGVESGNNRHAAFTAEKDFLQHYQFNFNEQLSNDFEWPLYQILLAVDALRRQSTSSKNLAYVNLIEQSAEYLDQLSKRNLDFHKYINSNEVRRKIDILELMDSVLQLFKRDPRSYFKGVAVTVQPDVPRYFVADLTRLSQIITNLLSALIKYGVKGDVSVKVSCNSNIKRPVFSFTVQHTGVFVEKEQLPYIFGGIKADDTSGKEQAHIPGLYLVKKLVDISGGEMQVKSGSKTGTVINLDIPVQMVEKKSESIADEDDEVQFPQLPNLKILVVEDSNIDRMVLTNALEEYGFSYEVAVNGIDALKMLNSDNFDLVLMDLFMPHLDGYQTISKIRNNINEKVRVVPVLALSSAGGQRNLQEVVNLGANDYLLKPVNKKNLLKKMLSLSGHLNVQYLNTYLAEDKRESFEVDIQAFRESSLGDLKFMIGLMENVIDQTEESMILINKFIIEDDFDSLKKVIHKIKPIIKLYGIPALDKALEEAEALSVRKVDFKQWQDLMDEIRILFNQAIRSLNNEILNIRQGVFQSASELTKVVTVN